MQVTTGEAVLCAFLFLLPGFVWSAAYAMLIPRKLDTENIRFMEFFTLSCINNAFWSWLIYLSYVKRLYAEHLLIEASLVFLIVFASPVIAAVVSAQFKRRGWSARFIEWLGFNTALQIKSAWEFKFSTTSQAWVAVHLKNGEQIFGLFGQDSFAGDASAVDLYILRRRSDCPAMEDQSRNPQIKESGSREIRLLQWNLRRLQMATPANRNEQLFRIEYGYRPRIADGSQPKTENARLAPPPPERFVSSIMPPPKQESSKQ